MSDNTVYIEMKGSAVTSSIDGVGIEQLKEVIAKMNDGYAWHLEIYSVAEIPENRARRKVENLRANSIVATGHYEIDQCHEERK